MKPIAISKNDELIMMNSNGRLYTFTPVTQDYIDDLNDLDNIKDTYGYMWDEMADYRKAEYDNEMEYYQGIIDSSSGYYLGHDDSYIGSICDSLKSHFDYKVITWECVSSGGDLYYKDFKKVFDQTIVDELIKKRKKNEQSLKANKKLEKIMKKNKAIKHWSGFYLIKNEAA